MSETTNKTLTREKEKLFEIRLLKGAIDETKSGNSMVDKPYKYDDDATEAFQTGLKDIFIAIDDGCARLNNAAGRVVMESLGRIPPDFNFEFVVTTGETIWVLIEQNARWQREWKVAFKSILNSEIGGACKEIIAIGTSLMNAIDCCITLGPTTPTGQKFLANIPGDLIEFRDVVQRQAVLCTQSSAVMCSEWLLNYIRREKNDAKAIIKVRAGKGLALFMDVGVIGGNIAHTVLSFGGTAPLAILSIVRQCIDIVQIGVLTALAMDDLAKLINIEVDAAVKYYSSKKGKAIGIEIVANVAQGVLNADFMPSISTCNKFIEEYEHKTRALKSSYNQLQHHIARMNMQMGVHKKVVKTQEWQDASPESRKAMIEIMAQCTKTYLEFDLVAQDKDGRIDIAIANVADWHERLADLEKKTGKYTKYISKGVSFITSAGLGMGHVGGEAVETAAEIAHKTVNLIIESQVVVAEGLGETLMEMLRKPVG
jgi:hypothetical protein